MQSAAINVCRDALLQSLLAAQQMRRFADRSIAEEQETRYLRRAYDAWRALANAGLVVFVGIDMGRDQ